MIQGYDQIPIIQGYDQIPNIHGYLCYTLYS